MNTRSLRPQEIQMQKPRARWHGVQIHLLTLVAALVMSAPAIAQHDHEEGAGPVARVLGDISFPTSTQSVEAQQAFIRGMLLLHLFEYSFAREEFISAQQHDPDFAMAYWGEAMTHNHPVWDEQDLEAGRAALQKFAASAQQRQDAIADEKERAWFAAVEVLYGEGAKAERDRAYARALENMSARFHEDHEVQLFYALSILGVSAGVRDIPTYMFSTAISQSVFSVNPRHPGAAHYLIHGVDDPDHAVLGLAAARALGEMAPDAGHSLHMTSHIFTALGMWDDVVRANEAAVRVENAMRKEKGDKPRHWGHYNAWLIYGYLQQGRWEKARTLLNAAFKELQEVRNATGNPLELDPDRSQLGSVIQMWTRYLIETADWNGEISEWKFSMGDAFDPNLTYTFTQSMRAGQAGQAALATQYLEQFRRLKLDLEQALRVQDQPTPLKQLYLQRLAVMEQEMLTGIESARGAYLAAAGVAAEASRLEGLMPYSYGPPFVDWPSAELQGAMLLRGRKYADAAMAFDVSLKRARLRSQSLLGLARSQEKQGRDAEAAYAWDKLRGNWHAADEMIRKELEAMAPRD